jgi:hypothetical protein
LLGAFFHPPKGKNLSVTRRKKNKEKGHQQQQQQQQLKKKKEIYCRPPRIVI